MTSTAPGMPGKNDQSPLLSRMRHWALLRIVVLLAVLIVIIVVTGITSKVFLQPLPPVLRHNLYMVLNLTSAAALLAAYAVSVHFLERRPAKEIALVRGAPQLLIGLVLGALLMSAVCLILWSLGNAHFVAGTGFDGLLGGLVAMFAAAVLEELFLRAVLFRIVEQISGTTIAVFLSAAVFGLLHSTNPSATPWSSAAIAIEAGIMLALAYVLTRNLWLAIGIHAGWNFTEGSIFGAQVSGSSEAHSLIRSSLIGPDMLTGGAFGPEASLVAVGVCLLFSAALAFVIFRRGGWQQRTFQLWLA